MYNPKWDWRFLRLAREVSLWSKDPSTKVGAVIVRPDRTIASLGYNGFPRGTTDLDEEYADRAHKYRKVIHAEMNALLNARGSVEGCTLYCWPPGLAATCERCAVHVIQAGIVRVVGAHPSADELAALGDRWSDAWKLAREWYSQAGVQCDLLTEPYD